MYVTSEALKGLIVRDRWISAALIAFSVGCIAFILTMHPFFREFFLIIHGIFIGFHAGLIACSFIYYDL